MQHVLKLLGVEVLRAESMAAPRRSAAAQCLVSCLRTIVLIALMFSVVRVDAFVPPGSNSVMIASIAKSCHKRASSPRERDGAAGLAASTHARHVGVREPRWDTRQASTSEGVTAAGDDGAVGGNTSDSEDNDVGAQAPSEDIPAVAEVDDSAGSSNDGDNDGDSGGNDVWARAELPLTNDQQVAQATDAMWKVHPERTNRNDGL